MTELIKALERLILAAEQREYTIGDPINLITVKAELAAAVRQARIALAKAAGEQHD